MSQVVQCPGCGSQYTAEDAQIGTHLQCTTCNQAFLAQAPGDPNAPPQLMAYAVTPTGSGKAVASMVLGIVSIPTCVFYGIPSLVCGILALVFGYTARSAIRRLEMPPSAGGMARAGRICGVVGIILSLAYWAILVGFIAMFAGSASSGRGRPFGP